MGQQFYVIRNNPAPGTEAARLKEERDRRKAASKGSVVEAGATDAEPAAGAKTGTTDPGSASDRRPQQRQQPKRQSKSQRQSKGPRNGGAAPTGNARAQNEKRDGNKQ
jgi:YidC/Oxa1 family membrane protein insertase